MGLALYFLPTMIGFRKGNAGAIFALNLLLGWTILGWVGALVWALTKEEIPNSINVSVGPAAPAAVAGATANCPVCQMAQVPGEAYCRACGASFNPK